MYPNLELHPSLNPLKHRFNQVKRINDNQEVEGFYKNCVKRLNDISKWGYMSLFDFAYRVTAHDKFGFLLSRNPEMGDYIKVTATTHFGVNSILLLQIENLAYEQESSFSEEVFTMNLRETGYIGVHNEISHSQQLKSRCDLKLRRILNTVSMDMKVDEQNMVTPQQSLMHYFKWETFGKQILLQL